MCISSTYLQRFWTTMALCYRKFCTKYIDKSVSLRKH